MRKIEKQDRSKSSESQQTNPQYQWNKLARELENFISRESELAENIQEEILMRTHSRSTQAYLDSSDWMFVSKK